ncbi:hypothetical protein P3T76_008845 [Phytophthora citrophthora]|uniref:Necrosis inducing-like protein NPP1 type n=1 Tax=Phytophthora citrophthora TaxID=4793 RepID=A0AAD9GHU3_9STRA|nr:hypothetical protein P3T76_008845 [Phytophthora citrophthora]
MVLWLDNPDLETPKILGASLSRQTRKAPTVMFIPMGYQDKDPYKYLTEIPPMGFVGTHGHRGEKICPSEYKHTYTGGSNVSTRVTHAYSSHTGWVVIEFLYAEGGEYQDLIMWNQLTDQARAALESADFGDAQVPFNDKNFETTLAQAWPF